MKAFHDVMTPCSTDTSPRQRVLGIGGSPRKGGNSDILLHHIVRGAAERGIDTRSLQLRDFKFQGCIGCERCRRDRICTGLHDGMSLIYGDIVASRGLVLVSPTHNYNITAWMKACIDRLYCFYDYDDHRPRRWTSRLAGQGRRAIVAAVCEQADRADMGYTLDAMRHPLEALGYDIVGELPVFGVFDRGHVKGDAAILAEASRLGAELADAVTR